MLKITTLYKCLVASKSEPFAVKSKRENFTVPPVNNTLTGNFLSQQFKYELFELQLMNHRIVEVGRSLWR